MARTVHDWSVQTTMGTVNLLGLPTDTFACDFVATTTASSSSSSSPSEKSSVRSSQQRRQEHHQQQQLPFPTAAANTTLTTTMTKIHTVLVFVPGNPGLVEWYIPFFEQVLFSLGPGYAVRGVANASHSIDPSKVPVVNTTTTTATAKHPAIPWTVDGQAMHKCAFVDTILAEFSGQAHLIFVSHSIGCHFTQRLLIWRPDILNRTKLVLQLMPFIRMKPNNNIAKTPSTTTTSWLLNRIGANPEMLITLSQSILIAFQTLATYTATSSSSSLSSWIIRNTLYNTILQRIIPDPDGRDILWQLLQIPEFARNFFTLGCEEIRDVPQVFDVCALRYIVRHLQHHHQQQQQNCMVMLFAKKDCWAPEFHLQELQQLQAQGIIPKDGISLTYQPELQHDFVSAGAEQVDIVAKFCLHHIFQQQTQQAQAQPPSSSKAPPPSTPNASPVPSQFQRSRL